jgi:hypothetical protein
MEKEWIQVGSADQDPEIRVDEYVFTRKSWSEYALIEKAAVAER